MNETYLQEKFYGVKDQVLQFDNNLQIQAVYPTFTGIFPQILVTRGTNIKATCNGIELVGTSLGDNRWEINVPFTGTWVISGQYNGNTFSIEQEVTTARQYIVTP